MYSKIKRIKEHISWMPVTISLVRKRVVFAFGGCRLIPGTVDYRDRGFRRRRRNRYVTGKRSLVYRDKEKETAQVQNVEFLVFFLEKNISMNVR